MYNLTWAKGYVILCNINEPLNVHLDVHLDQEFKTLYVVCKRMYKKIFSYTKDSCVKKDENLPVSNIIGLQKIPRNQELPGPKAWIRYCKAWKYKQNEKLSCGEDEFIFYHKFQ